MSDGKKGGGANWVQYAITTVIGIGWSIFDRWAKLQPIFEPWIPWVSPIVYMAIGAAIGYMICQSLDKKKFESKDTEISELKKRPTQETVDRLNESHAAALDAKDAEIAKLGSPVEAMGRTISALSDNEKAMVGTLRGGALKTPRYGEILSHLESLGIAKRLRAAGVFTPTWGLTSTALESLNGDESLSKSVAAASEIGVRDFNAERRISAQIRTLSQEQLGAVAEMHRSGFFDYPAVDNCAWGYERNQGADDLDFLKSQGIAKYETLGNGERRWSLTDDAHRCIEDDPDLITEGIRYIERILNER